MTPKSETMVRQPSPATRLDATAITILIAMCLCLAVGQVAMKVANQGISPVLQAGLRSVGGALILALFARWRGIALFERNGILWPAIACSFFFAAEFALLYPGLQATTVAHAIILLYTSPVVVAVGAHFLIPGDRLTGAKSAGLLLALAGVASVVLGRDTSATTGGPTLYGDLLCLAAALAWGALTLVIRTTRLATVPAERVTFLQLLISAPVLCALSWALGEPGITNPTPLVLGSFGFTVIFVAGFVFTTTTWLFTRYPASRVMAFLLLTPVFGVLASHMLLGEPLGSGVIAGLALVLAGLWLVNRPARR
ncbi:MAG: DMT family transporter [Hyphomicrobiaceae bacterium]